MEEILKEKIEFDLDSYKKAYKFHHRKRFPIKSRLYLIFGTLVFVLAIPLIVLSYLVKNTSDVFFGFFMVLMAAYYLYRHFTMFDRMAKLEKKLSREGINKCSYRIDSNGYTEISEEHTSNYKWDYFEEVEIQEDIILLYIDRLRYCLFYRTNYSDEEFETMKKWILAKVKVIK